MSDFERKVALGIEAFQSGQLGMAIDAFESALAINDESADVHQNLAGALCQNGDIDRGLEHFARAAALAPGDSEILRNFGYAYKVAGRLDDAIAQYDQCLAIDPDNAVARVNLANAFYDAGRKDDAREQCNIVVTSGINETAMLHAADLLKKIGPDPSAKPKHTDRALELADGMMKRIETGLGAVQRGVQEDPSPEFLGTCALAMSQIPTVYNAIDSERDRAWREFTRAHGLATMVCLDPITPLPESPPSNINAVTAIAVQECLTSALNRAAPSAYGANAISESISNLAEIEAELADDTLEKKATDLRALFEKKSSGCFASILIAAAIPALATIAMNAV